MKYVSQIFFIDAVYTRTRGCICPGDTLVYKCTVLRGLATIWTGSAFNCSHSANELYLLENSINYNPCNNGVIVANVIDREERSYTSQLIVTVTSDIVGETVECHHYDGLFRNVSVSSVIVTAGMSSCRQS